MVTIFGVVSGALRIPDMSRAAGPAASLVFAASFVSIGLTYKLPRFLWLAGLSVLLGAGTLFVAARAGGMLWVMVGIGAAMAASGAMRLRRFLQTHPIVQEHA